ncbi:hypothetical protein K3495_g17364, partial [Podosphaera aphanis]
LVPCLMFSGTINAANVLLTRANPSVVFASTATAFRSCRAGFSNVAVFLAVETLRKSESRSEDFCGFEFKFPHDALLDCYVGLLGPIKPDY